MQTPTGNTGQHVQPVDWNMWASVAADLAAWKTDDYAQQNVVIPGGGTLTPQAGTPIVVDYAAFVAYVNGPARMARYSMPSGSVTLAAADATYGRYDLIVGTASQTTPNDSAGNPTALDVLTVTKVTGTPASSPVVPALPANSVQLGYVLVPANATSATTCTITQALGPLSPKNFQDLTNHIAANITATTAVHGIKQGSGNGLDADSVDGYHAGGGAGQIPVRDGSGHLDAYTLQGDAPSAFDLAGAAGAVQTNLNTHTGADISGTVTVHGLRLQVVTITGISINAGQGRVGYPFGFGPMNGVIGTFWNLYGDNNSGDNYQDVTVTTSSASAGTLTLQTASNWAGSAQVLVLGS